MREIKFRGLVIEPLASGEKWISSDEEYHEVYINRVEKTAYINGHAVIYESVGQYTGLKDKNGREIYEGDIVMQLSERTYDSLTGVVKFIDGSYVIETADGKNGGYLFDEYLFDELAFNVLIGNIYENPELLEDGTDYDSLIRWDEI